MARKPMTEEQRAAKRAYDKARYLAKREETRARAAAWYAANRKKVLKRSAEKHAAAAIAAGREPHKSGAPRRFNDAERKARAAAALKAWRKANPEKHRAQSRRHYHNTLPRILATARNRRARIKGNGGTHTAADIAALRKKQRGKCAFCLKPLGKKTPDIDHYVPIALGGTNDRSNLRLLHARCNRSKHDAHPADFGLAHGLLAW